MEQVMWFFADEEKNVVVQVLCGISEEEKAIDELTLQAPKGRYMLGYAKTDGTQKLFNSSRQIVG